MGINWSELYQHRRTIAGRFGNIWDLPLARRYNNVLEALGRGGTSLLEIGAGDRALQDKMTAAWGSFEYRSCDIDDRYDHDFGSIGHVTGSFDIVCGFEVIEHVTLVDAADMIRQSERVLKPGGCLALTTPNIFYPPGFLRDATHITPFCYDELGGLASYCGLEVEAIYRLHHDSLIKKWIKRVVAYPLYRMMGIDFAHQIMVVARKPG